MTLRISPALPLFLLVLAACSKTDTGQQKEVPAAPSASGAAPASPQQADQAQQIALSAIDGWAKAQSDGDFERYMAFYDVSFKGVRRTSDGKQTVLDLEGWRKDRQQQVQNKPRLAAENRKVETWVEKPDLGAKHVEVRFTQRFQATSGYADHGPKVIRMRIDGSQARFVHEDMLSSSKGWSDSETTATKTDFSAWKFVRTAPSEKKGVDACAFIGGLGFACLDAYMKETDTVKKRFMRLSSDADAREEQSHLDQGTAGGAAHAELAMHCADSGPCQKQGDSMKDDGYACLTKAQTALAEGKKAEATAAHERACKCDAKRAVLPVMGGTLACDGPNKPSNRGKVLSAAEAKNARACAMCDPKTGPAACASVIDSLKGEDQALASYVINTHVPRCQKP